MTLFSDEGRAAKIRAYVMIVIGCVIGGAAYPLFLVPNSIAPGGLTGIATILNFFFKTPVGIVSMAMNVPLFIMGYRTMGRIFALRSLIATLLFSVCIDLIQIPPVTNDMLLASVYGGILLGVGLGLIFRGGATTGGTDMIARMVHKRFQFITVGAFLFLIDCVVVLGAGVTMSASYALYALICIFVQSKAIDLVLDGFGTDKVFFVISGQSEGIARNVIERVGRGATLIDTVGAYSGKKSKMMISVVGRGEVVRMKNLIHEADDKAFVFITDAHETLGEGFAKLSGEE